ncbi:hypothetical protein GCM10019059_27640 [Camelimonas fluminis]|uniref:TIGR01841 family phasin n=1 Tax=Camelimonas fluminis TaxID=1576911 RepID=A0ABV7UDJ3_9HYPH|nr:phasin family protein [Camelimonas fluminis]GHE66336.1 hypothetical protein GCM10019059_27640 [Camelimonas fluminis]
MAADNDKQAERVAGAIPGLDDFKKLVERYRLPNVDVTALLEWHRKDMEALVEANQKANEGIRALIERRQEILSETFAEWQGAVKTFNATDPLSKRTDMARRSVEKAVANFRELTQLEVQAHANAWKVVQERMRENMSNLQNLLKAQKTEQTEKTEK